MKSLLFVGDAACSSGFGRAADQILKILAPRYKVSVIGVNFQGDYKAAAPRAFDIYPAWPGRDALGIGRITELIKGINPDVIVLQTNPWHVPVYAHAIHKAGFGKTPIIGIIAVEGKNCRGDQLNVLTKAIFWVDFAREEALKGGMSKKIETDVIPLGVDTEVFRPGNRVAARHKLGIHTDVPDDAFIVLNVNRNQTRKRLDLSLLYFAEWIKSRKIRDAYLYMHTLPGSTVALDLDRLALYAGIEDRFVLAEPRDIYNGAPEHYMTATYQAADVFLTTTLGEGFGLTPFEAAATALPVLAGRYAALGELGKDAFWLLDVDAEGVMPDVNGMIGATPTKAEVIQALDYLYENPDARQRWGTAAYALAQEPRFNWTNIANRFADSIEAALVATPAK